jgi:hypothetical protein
MTLTKPIRSALTILGVAILCNAANAQTMNIPDDKWEYGITPYGWFPSIHGTFNFDVPFGSGGAPEVNVNPSSYLSDLQFAGMVAGTAHKGAWGVFYDLIYTDLAGLKSTVHDVRGPGGIVSLPVSADVGTGMRAGIATLTATYSMVKSDAVQMDVIGGVRYAGIRTSVNWNFDGPLGLLGRSGSTSKSVDLWDGIVGVAGNVRLSGDGKWYMPFEADVGGGSKSSTTANGTLGVGYKFGWGDVVLAYRYLYYDMGSDGPIHNMSLAGPALGATFHW